MSLRTLNKQLGKTMSLRTGAALLVSGCLGLGVYSAVADGNDPEVNPVAAMNDVLFVGAVGALIDSTLRDSSVADSAADDEPTTGIVSVDSSGEQFFGNPRADI